MPDTLIKPAPQKISGGFVVIRIVAVFIGIVVVCNLKALILTLILIIFAPLHQLMVSIVYFFKICIVICFYLDLKPHIVTKVYRV